MLVSQCKAHMFNFNALFVQDVVFVMIAVLECPTIDYLDNLLSLQQFQETDFVMIAHMSPVAVTEDARYQSFVDRSACLVAMSLKSFGVDKVLQEIQKF